MRIPQKRYLIPLFIIALLLIRFVAKIGFDRVPADRFRVVRVIDGDTIELAGGDRLRLLGIDCPEKGELFYDSATACLKNLVIGKIVEVSFSRRRRDGYGRLLGYLSIDSLHINEAILRNGLGNIYLFKDNINDKTQLERLMAAQNDAIDNKRGIWSQAYFEEPYYMAVKGKFRFHRPSCSAVRNLPPDRLIKLDNRLDAFRRAYSPCRNCRP